MSHSTKLLSKWATKKEELEKPMPYNLQLKVATEPLNQTDCLRFAERIEQLMLRKKKTAITQAALNEIDFEIKSLVHQFSQAWYSHGLRDMDRMHALI